MKWWHASLADVRTAAKEECGRRGWLWQEPVRVSRTLAGFSIWTNAGVLDNNPWFHLDRHGRIVRSGYARRRPYGKTADGS